MPQFDKITFFTQIHWLLITFFVIYYFLLIYIPKILIILKSRNKRIGLLTKKIKRVNRRYIVNLRFYRFVLFRTAFRFKNILSEYNSIFELWLSNYTFNLMFFKMNPLGFKNLFKNAMNLKLLKFL